MDLTYASYYSLEITELLKNYYLKYQQYILIGFLVIAILNCFFGYHLRKVWGILAGTIIGSLAGAAICIYLDKLGTIFYIATVSGALVLALLALLLYRVGLFFLGAVLIPLILTKLFPTQKLETLILWVILGLVTSTVALVWERETVSLMTAVGGGFETARLLMLLRNHQSSLMLLMIGIGLSLAGILLQFQPWRSRSAWNSDEGRARDKHRHNRRMKRIRKKQKRQERMERRQSTNRIPSEEPVEKRSTTEYIPYTTRPIYTGQIPAEQDAANPDLSDIRQAISKEVSDIYMEQQQDMDQALNQLLEKEYRHTTEQLRKR